MTEATGMSRLGPAAVGTGDILQKWRIHIEPAKILKPVASHVDHGN
jgi:hypothetical protein